MRRRLTAWIVAGLGPALAAFAPQVAFAVDRGGAQALKPVAVFGNDDRVSLPPRYLRWQEALGVLFNIRTRTVCTAFCVAEGMVATAAHCLYRTSGDKPSRLADVWFARNYDQVRDYARIAGHNSGAAAQNVLAGSTKLSVSPPIDATSDWALVRLARPACTKGVFEVLDMTPEEIMRESEGKRLFHLGYHRDFTLWRAAYSTPCSVSRRFETADWPTIAADFSSPDQLVLHTCDTGGASSGSPLLAETADGPKVVAINVGTYIQSKVFMSEGQVTRRQKPDTVANTGVAVAAFASRLEAFRAAAILGTATQMRELQERLKQRGHFEGAVDGTYGPTVRAAIEAFETRERLPVTGIASLALLKRLREPASR